MRTRRHFFVPALLVTASVTAQNGWTIYDQSTGLNSDLYGCIAVDQGGNVWAGGPYAGLEKFNGSTWTGYTSFNSDLLHDEVRDLLIDGSNRLWAGTYKGISVFNGSTWTSYDTNNTVINGMSISAMTQDAGGQIWITSRNGSFDGEGVSIFNGSSWSNLTGYPTQIDGDDIPDLVVSSSNVAWICANGLTKYTAGTFTFYPYATTGLWNSNCTAFDGSGNLWVGGFDGLLKYDGTWHMQTNATLGLTSNTGYWDIFPDGNILWIGTSNGFIKYNRTTGNIVTIYDSGNSPLEDNCVYGITKDGSGFLWLATTIGVVKMDPNAVVGINEQQGAASLVRVYPNPSSGLVNVVRMEGAPESMEAIVRDAQGRIVHAEALGAVNVSVIDLGGLAKGIYTLDLVAEGSSVSTQRIALD